MKPFTIGADPEVFLFDKAVRRSVPATLCFHGSKDAPEPLDCGTVIHDNVAAEFTVPPSTDRNGFVTAIRTMREAVLKAAQERLVNENIVLDFKSSSRVWTKKQLDHPDTQKFGCDPDFDAWRDGEVNEKPPVEELRGLRSAGGHIHVGVDDEWFQRRVGQIITVKVLDASVGQMIASWEQAAGNAINHRRRRTMYGAAGCFRPKPYGVEYRSPSPVWCESDDKVRVIYDLVGKVVTHLNDYKEKALQVILDECLVTGHQIQQSVNRSTPIRELMDYWD